MATGGLIPPTHTHTHTHSDRPVLVVWVISKPGTLAAVTEALRHTHTPHTHAHHTCTHACTHTYTHTPHAHTHAHTHTHTNTNTQSYPAPPFLSLTGPACPASPDHP